MEGKAAKGELFFRLDANVSLFVCEYLQNKHHLFMVHRICLMKLFFLAIVEDSGYYG